ncbi:MAG: beta-lactamase family protein [Gemmatimonadaceae bacterium]|nr:beta-lactamase family protein [Gemmatimonadaceae bacterium]
MRNDTNTAARVTQLIRLKEFDAAVKIGRLGLANPRGTLARPAECRTLTGVVYAEWARNQQVRATEALSLLDRTCRNVNVEIGRGYLEYLNLARAALAAGTPSREVRSPEATRVSSEPYALPPSALDDGLLPRVAPGATGLDTSVLLLHRDLCARSNADACVIVHKGRIVQEWYGQMYREPMHAMSSTKSITGLLVGMLLAEGKLRSIDERVCTFLADWCDGLRGRVTLRHLMSMTAGLPNITDRRRSVGFANDKNALVRSLTPTSEPGSQWAYSNEGVQLLSPILDRAAGEPIHKYAKRKLFDPLGLQHTRLMVDEKLHAWTYADMITTPRELARIGVMVAQKGVWRGRRIVDASWIELSAQPSQQLNDQYGLLWWTAMPHEQRFAALGSLNTDVHIMPDREIVVVRMQRKAAQGNPYKPDAYELFSRLSEKAVSPRTTKNQ